MGSLPSGNTVGAGASPRPLSASSSYSSIGGPNPGYVPSGLAPPPIMPGSALRLLNQGRAQGLFTPSTSQIPHGRNPGYTSSYTSGYTPQSPFASTPPQNQQTLKRTRSDAESHSNLSLQSQGSSQSLLDAPANIPMSDGTRPSPATPHVNGEEGPSPTKRARTDPSPPQSYPPPTRPDSRTRTATPLNGASKPPSSLPSTLNGKPINGSQELDPNAIRYATKPPTPRHLDPSAPLKDTRRAAIITAICQQDDPTPVLDLIREVTPDSTTNAIDVDVILDDQGHTALHLAASMARQRVVDSLVSNGADVYRGNYLGETALVRACLATHNADQQTFNALVTSLHQSIRTLDTSRKSVIHHIVSLAGVKGRAPSARYYLDQIFYWIAHRQNGDFKSLVDLQDEHGDTALNIAARVGNRSLVRTLLDVGANRILPNKLGLRPGDFGVETEVSVHGNLSEQYVYISAGTQRRFTRRRPGVFSEVGTIGTSPEESGCYCG